MDLMSIRRGLMSQMAQGEKILSGSWTQNATNSVATIDTGSTDWNYLLITPRVFPYTTGTARCIGLKFVNMQTKYMITAHGSSSDGSTTASTSTSYSFDGDTGRCEISNGVVSLKGVASQVGVFVAGCVYDWYAW